MQFLSHCSVVVQLEVGDDDSPKNSFIVENSFSYCGFLLFQMNLQIVVSNFMKN